MSDTSSRERTGPDEPRAISEVIERLLTRALEMRMRAAAAADSGSRQLYEATATAYEQWAFKMQPLEDIRVRLDEKAAEVTRRFRRGNGGE